MLKESKMLPNLYEMDDFERCIKNENVYCRIDAELLPTNPNSAIWKAIEKTKQLKSYYFDRSKISRLICIPKENSTSSELMQNYSSSILSSKFENLTVSPNITKINCLNNEAYWKYPQYLTLVMMCTCLYIGWIIFATIYERKTKQKPNEWITSFSLQKNWRALTSLKDNEDARNLKCIQGTRVITLACVITVHFMMFLSQLYISDVGLLEMVFQHMFLKMGATSILFIVQTFFVISSWLLTNQIYDIYNKNGEFTVEDSLILFINRCFRFWPTLIVNEIMIAQFNIFYGPQTFELAHMLVDSCSKGWLPTLLFYNNFYMASEVCNGGTWYISTDTQYYAAVLALCYFVLKFQLNMKKVLSIAMALSVATFGLLKFYYNLPAVFPVALNNIQRENLWYDETYPFQYSGPLASLSTSLIGVALGYVYYHNKQNKFHHGKVTKILWASSFVGLPLAALALATLSDGLGRFGAATLGAVLRPTYALGIGLGLLGMTFSDTPSRVKSVYEWKPFVILANFSFSIYVWHFIPIFAKGTFTYTLLDINFLEQIVDMVLTFIVSISLGTVCCLLIEQPFGNLQKKILPQVKKKVVKRKETLKKES